MIEEQNLQQRIQKQSNLQFRKCTELQSSYVKGSHISSSESWKLEFKNYTWPFLTLLKTISSFLNREGGTILIGVSDTKKVVGIKVDNIDELKRYIDKLKDKFYPQPQGLIKTSEIPVKQVLSNNDDEQYQWLPHTYVVRIEVKQGKVDRFYTFKFGQQTCSAFREDASSALIRDQDDIQEHIYKKCLHPSEISKPIQYEEADEEGLEECSNQHQQQIVHEHKGNYIAITNIMKNKLDIFLDFLDQRLKTKNLPKLEYFVVSNKILYLTCQQIAKLYSSINDINHEHFYEILKLTTNKQDLQFGFPKKSLTVKVYTDEEYHTVVSAASELGCQGSFQQCSGYKEILLYDMKNQEDLAIAYSYFSDLDLKTFINLKKPENITLKKPDNISLKKVNKIK